MQLERISVEEKDSLCVPAHRFRQGGRDVYSFPLNLEMLDRFLPERIDDEVVIDANRPLTASHAQEIQDYLQKREDWLLGSLLLGIDSASVQFDPYTKDRNVTVGELRISQWNSEKVKMLDGQHRRRAIRKLLLELPNEPGRRGKRESLSRASIPVILYAENRIHELRQMFSDAARTKPVEQNAVTRFDQRNAFSRAAVRLATGDSELLAGRVDMERTSVPRSGQHLLAVNQLALTLKTLFVGFKGRISRERNEEYLAELETLCERCCEWADDFLPAARQEYEDLMAGEVDNSEIPIAREGTLTYNATVLRVLAGCYFMWDKDLTTDRTPLAQFIRKASFEPRSGKGSLLVDAGLLEAGGLTPFARQSLVVGATSYIVHLAKQSIEAPEPSSNSPEN